jgi:hypothetical protein
MYQLENENPTALKNEEATFENKLWSAARVNFTILIEILTWLLWWLCKVDQTPFLTCNLFFYSWHDKCRKCGGTFNFLHI